MGGYLSFDKVIDNEVDYQKYQARLKRKETCIKNYKSHIDYLRQEYQDLCNEINDVDFSKKCSFYKEQTYSRKLLNRERLINLYEDIDRL